MIILIELVSSLPVLSNRKNFYFLKGVTHTQETTGSSRNVYQKLALNAALFGASFFIPETLRNVACKWRYINVETFNLERLPTNQTAQF